MGKKVTGRVVREVKSKGEAGQKPNLLRDLVEGENLVAGCGLGGLNPAIAVINASATGGRRKIEERGTQRSTGRVRQEQRPQKLTGAGLT